MEEKHLGLGGQVTSRMHSGAGEKKTGLTLKKRFRSPTYGRQITGTCNVP